MSYRCSRVPTRHAVADQPLFVRRELQGQKTRRHTHPHVPRYIPQRNEMHVLVPRTDEPEGAVGISGLRSFLRRPAVSFFFMTINKSNVLDVAHYDATVLLFYFSVVLLTL